ncbi:hypothetical protein OAU50_01950 [Planctomycetota bacterium]|nr:hypothetical protein [Planctomycetota bacterium]
MQQAPQTDLQTIRAALEANARLTSLSGAAMLASGLLTFFAAGITASLGLAEPASRNGLQGDLLLKMVALWSATFVIAVGINLAGMVYRARRDGQSLAMRLGRRFLFAMLPAIAVGGALSLGMALQAQLETIFAVWMLTYGAALLAASAHSITSVRVLGLLALICGVLGVVPGLDLDFVLFLTTFGAGHFLLGIWVGVRHGW